MCFDATRPEAAPLVEAVKGRALPEWLRLLADSAHAAATEIESLRAENARLKAEARGRPAP